MLHCDYVFFTGQDCEDDLDDCDPDPCDPTGTLSVGNGGGCVDLLDDYQCICRGGYTGKNCTVRYFMNII